VTLGREDGHLQHGVAFLSANDIELNIHQIVVQGEV
jgi:hypothetical protein